MFLWRRGETGDKRVVSWLWLIERLDHRKIGACGQVRDEDAKIGVIFVVSLLDQIIGACCPNEIASSRAALEGAKEAAHGVCGTGGPDDQRATAGRSDLEDIDVLCRAEHTGSLRIGIDHRRCRGSLAMVISRGRAPASASAPAIVIIVIIATATGQH